ncbi:MAG: DUF3592 domain-containing protein [Planctomycetota bacterium]
MTVFTAPAHLIRAMFWRSVPAEVVAVDVIMGSNVYARPVVSYHYRLDDVTYFGDRYQLFPHLWWKLVEDVDLPARMTPGGQIDVWVNPWMPGESVIHRGLRPESPTYFCLLGITLLFSGIPFTKLHDLPVHPKHLAGRWLAAGTYLMSPTKTHDRTRQPDFLSMAMWTGFGLFTIGWMAQVVVGVVLRRSCATPLALLFLAAPLWVLRDIYRYVQAHRPGRIAASADLSSAFEACRENIIGVTLESTVGPVTEVAFTIETRDAKRFRDVQTFRLSNPPLSRRLAIRVDPPVLSGRFLTHTLRVTATPRNGKPVTRELWLGTHNDPRRQGAGRWKSK